MQILSLVLLSFQLVEIGLMHLAWVCFFKQSPYIFNAKKLDKEATIEHLFKQQRAFRKHSKSALNISASLTAALQSTASLQFMFNYYHFFPHGSNFAGAADYLH